MDLSSGWNGDVFEIRRGGLIYLQAMACKRKRKASTCPATVQIRTSVGESTPVALPQHSQGNHVPGMRIMLPNPITYKFGNSLECLGHVFIDSLPANLEVGKLGRIVDTHLVLNWRPGIPIVVVVVGVVIVIH
jgi:hypothetical protein